MSAGRQASRTWGLSTPMRAGLALVLGVLHAATFSPPLDAWALQLAVLAALCRLSWDGAAGAPRRRAAVAAAFGLGWFCAGLGWLHTSMHVYGGMPTLLAALAVLLFAAYLSLFPLLALGATARWFGTGAATSRDAAARALALGACWGAAEMARGWLLTGFPWLAIGYAHVDGPLAGFAPWVGVYGVSALAALTAGLAAEATILWGRGGPARKAGTAFAAAAALPLLAGAALVRLEHTAPAGPPVAVRLVQGNVPQQLKFDPQRARDAMQGYAQAIEGSTARLVVLPETAWTMPWHATPPATAARVADHLRATGASVAVGMPMIEAGARRADGRVRYTNSVALLQAQPAGDSSPGAPSAAAIQAGEPVAIAARYDKRHLVPFGEFVPTGFGWFVALMNIPLGEFGRGAARQAPFEVAGQRFAFNVCYEDLFGEELVAAIRPPDGATVLVNVSNIAWFGDSRALPQHLAIARMRALETGRPMLRATNTGVTAAIDHRGRVFARLPNYRQGVLDVSVQGTTGLTPYAQSGNLLPMALIATLLASAAALRARSMARKR